MQCGSLHLSMQAFFMSADIVVSPYTGVRVPPCIGLMAIQHLFVNVLSDGTGSGTFCFIHYVTASRTFQRCIA